MTSLFLISNNLLYYFYQRQSNFSSI